MTDMLEVGDYFFNYGLVVERKKINDLVNAVKNNQDGQSRFYEQLRSMNDYAKKQNPKGISCLVVEGDVRQLFKGHPDYPIYDRVMASTVFFDKVSVLHSIDESSTITKLLYWQKREQEGSKGIQIRPRKRLISIQEQIEYVLCGFPKIGSKIAKEIMNVYPSLEELFKSDLSGIKRRYVREKIGEILRAKYGV